MIVEYEVTKPQDLTKINTSEMGELLWWSYILNVSPEKILTTTEKVGTSPEQVRKSLKTP